MQPLDLLFIQRRRRRIVSVCALSRRVFRGLVSLEMAESPRRAGSVILLKRNFCNTYFVLEMKKKKISFFIPSQAS